MSSSLLEEPERTLPPQLDPSLPIDHPISKRERYVAKFGAARLGQMEKTMAERFKEEGLSITYDGTIRQTTLSHRLIAKAYAVGGEEVQMKVVEAIYHQYFSLGKDIGDVAVLTPVAVENGMFPGEDEAKAWLEGNDGTREYNEGVAAAEKAGIRGVPYFMCVSPISPPSPLSADLITSESTTSGVYLERRTQTFS